MHTYSDDDDDADDDYEIDFDFDDPYIENEICNCLFW